MKGFKNIFANPVSRRSFLKLSAAAAGTTALAGCGTGLKKVSQDNLGTDEGVKVVPTTGPNNCGGRCVIKAHVKDNVILRLSTDDEPDDPRNPQIRACIRGRGYRKTYLRPDRLKYPMKRVGKRGEGKFERISWEEAVDTIASEIKRIGAKYGPASRYVNYAWGYNARIHPMYLAKRLLAMAGGHLDSYNTYSTACTSYTTPFTYGTSATGNTPDDWVNSKLLILWGFNPAETIHGSQTMYRIRQAKEAGAKVIVVDPRYTDTAIAFADEWIPLLPTTDNAVMDAMAYVMITENLHDQAFLDKYCLGFDEEHMPEGVPKGNSYKSYVLGDTDGIPKTPEWAEKLSKVPANTIRHLAREYATNKPAALIQGWGPQRHAYGEQPVRGATVLAAMTGNVGIHGGWASGAGYAGRQKIGSISTGNNPVKAKIPVFLWTDAIVRGTEMGPEDGVKGVDRLPSNIKLIMNMAGNCLINQHSDVNKTAEILQDESLVEFIVASEIFMTPSAKFADILLPGNTFFERYNIGTPWGYGDYVMFANKVIDNLYECRSEYDWLVEVADKLGIKDEFTEGNLTEEDWCRDIVQQTQKNHPEFPSYEEFKKRGVYKWFYDEPYVAFKKQIEDPENNPFLTPSGKIEIFSKRLYDMNKPKEIPAVPKYISSWEGPEDPLTEKYPLQCIGWHYKRRCHSVHDNNSWMEEAARQEMWMNPEDAKVRAIKTGDEVRVYNERGATILPVLVTSRIIPGVIAIPQGAWYTPNEKGEDTRGCINILTTHKPTPLAKGNPQHTNLAQVEKV